MVKLNKIESMQQLDESYKTLIELIRESDGYRRQLSDALVELEVKNLAQQYFAEEEVKHTLRKIVVQVMEQQSLDNQVFSLFVQAYTPNMKRILQNSLNLAIANDMPEMRDYKSLADSVVFDQVYAVARNHQLPGPEWSLKDYLSEKPWLYLPF